MARNMLLFLLSLFVCALSAPLTSRAVPFGVPDYVTKYAPIVYLYTTDPYRPSDIGAQLTNTRPEINYTAIGPSVVPLTLDNLNSSLASYNGSNIYLTATADIMTNPDWLNGVTPNADGETEGAVSCAIIVNDHGFGLVDAFYMYFYAFNYGGSYGADFIGYHIIGDHVGDWEHNMVRFQDGVPTAVWYSQHSNGEAFTYKTVEKWNNGTRPTVFSANGSHANYAIGGTHDHTIPDINLSFGPVEDHTNCGPVWDPTLSAYYYTYNASNATFAAYDSDTPVDWLYFSGHWGDEQYPDSDPRQQTAFGINGLENYGSGPTGPVDKHLNRTKVCPKNSDACILRDVLGP